jgi:hypothetical protein
MREPKRRRLDVVSLLNPTNTPGESTPSNLQSMFTATDNTPTDTLQGSPNQSHPQPAKRFSIFNPVTPKGNKRKAEEPVTAMPVKTVTGGIVVGMSRSARAARTRNKQVADGTFTVDTRKLLQFKRKIRLVDPGAGFMVDGNVKRVTHSFCGQTLTMKEPYNTAHFTRHTETCMGPPKTTHGRKNKSAPVPPGGGISRFLVLKKQAILPLQSFLPCPGLTGSQHEQIPIYLGRSGAPGGGATSRTIITKEFYDECKYRQLTKVQKANIRRIQVLRFRWINDHHEERIVSVRCLKMVATKTGIEEAEPCVECVALLGLSTLRSVLRRPVPDDKNLKYIPKECLSTLLGKLYATHLGLREIMESQVCHFLTHTIVENQPYQRQDNPCVVYAKGVLSGKYKSAMFPGMIAAFVTLEDKKRRGVGKQNFQYTPEFKEFMLILRSHGRHVYEFVATHIPVMEDRSVSCVVDLTFAVKLC